MTTDTKSFIRASEIIGTKLVDSSGDVFGQVTELLIDDDKGHVAFLVVERKGVLTATDNFYKVGWSDLSYDRASETMALAGKSFDDLESTARLEELIG